MTNKNKKKKHIILNTTTSSKLKRTMNSNKMSKDKYIPKIKDCQKWFGIINKEIFANNLPKFKKIKIIYLPDAWAICDGKHTKIKETRYCNLLLHKNFKNMKQFIKILCHEMVHHYEWIIDGDMSHGKNFMKWKPILVKFNVGLAIDY